MEEDTKGRRLRAERNLTRGQGDTTGQDTEWSEAKLDRATPRGKDDATLARGHADTLAQHTAAAADTRGDTRGGHERRHMRCDTNHWLTHPCAVAAGETHTLTHFHTAAAVAATATGQRSSVRPPAEGENLFLKAVLKKTMDDNIRIYFSQP